MCAVPAVDPTAVVATATVQAVLAFSQLLRFARAVHLVSAMLVYLVVAEALVLQFAKPWLSDRNAIAV